VQERLAQSLHNAVWLILGMERQDYRVQRPWSAVVQSSQSAVPLNAGTHIVDVFEDSKLAHQLLILGEPGAGKTTMMLELAEDLLKRARADNAEPIPVLLNLSSWKNPQQSIFDWLVDELKSKYGIGHSLAQRWLVENQLLPLLDGLDEVAPQYQKACAVALNTWLTVGDNDQKPYGVLICCRREEYQQVVQQPLSLYGAVYLQALTIEQIEDYFTQFKLQDVWGTVQQDEDLQELLTTPLFLSMFGLVQTQGKFSFDDWRDRTTSELKIEYLLDTYWDAAIERRLIIDPVARQQGIRSKTYGKKLPPQPSTVQRALVFVAKTLEEESQTELLIEGMQPYHLRDKLRQWQYWLFLFLGNLLASGTIATLLLFQWSQPPYPSVSWSSFLTSIVLLGSAGGFILSTESKTDGTRLIMYPFVQVYCFLLRKKLPTEFRKYIPILHEINLSLRFRLKIPSFKDLKHGVFNPSLEIAYEMLDSIWMPLVPLIMEIHIMSSKLAYVFGFKRLGRNLEKSSDLIIQRARTFTKQVDESRYPHHIFLAVITFQYVQMIKLKGGWLLNLALRLLGFFPSFITFMILISLNLISVLVTEPIEIEKILTPNYGLKEALRTAFLMSILFCISSFMAFQMPGTYYRGISCVLGFLSCYSYLPLIKHLSLRLVLWQSDTLPWNYPRFLNYCTERLILQRVGGRYRFIHKLLQDHFAKKGLG
jgi:DNA polymerase III delta prime subunit